MRAVIRILVLLLAGAAPAAPQTPAALIDDAAEAELRKLLEEARSAAGLPPLAYDTRLRDTARLHATYVEKNGRALEQFPEEPGLQERYAMLNLLVGASGENVGVGSDLRAIHAQLMAAEASKSKLLSRGFTAYGVGVVRRGDQYFVVQDFARLLDGQSAAEVEQIVVEAYNEARKAKNVPALALVAMPKLRAAACKMGETEKLDPSAAAAPLNAAASAGGGKAGPVAVRTLSAHAIGYNTMRPNELPEAAKKNGLAPRFGSIGVGACFARTKDFPDGVFWIVVQLQQGGSKKVEFR